MPEPTVPPAETFNDNTGLTNIDPSVFLHEDEGNGEEQHEDAPEGDQPPADGREAGKEKEEPLKTDDGEEEETPPKDPSKPEDEKKPEKVYAGKYKTVDDLKAALIELGIDPADYSSDSDLETAYKTAQATYTRVHQNEIEKRKQEIPTDETPDIEKLVTEANTKIDYSTIKNSEQLGQATVKAVLETLMPIMQKLKVNPDELAGVIGEKITTQSATTNALLTELRDVESKVPRLRTDKKFRDSFADFITGQKLNHTYTSLLDSAKSFVGGTEFKDDPKANRQNKEDKGSAAALPDNSEGADDRGKKTDEVDDILKAHNEHIQKFG